MSAGAAPRLLRVGLTGGIASGKSTVAKLLGDLGAVVLDADRVAHDVMAPGKAAFDRVAARFGPAILAPDGTIDRRALGAIVFRDAAARLDLEAIVHPAVIEEIERRIGALEAGGLARVAVIDAALLVESGYHRRVDRVIVLRCARGAQIERLLARGLSRDAAEARLAAQLPLEEKLAVAHYVIDTDIPLAETRTQVEATWAALLVEESMP